MIKNRHFGIIGGTGAFATHYLMGKIFDIATKTNNAIKDSDFPYITTINANNLEIDYKGNHTNNTYTNLLTHIKNLNNNGCDSVAFACNTLHQFIPQLQKDLPNIHIITLSELLKPILPINKRIGILSSEASSQINLLSICKNNTYIYLDDDDQIYLNNIINNVISKTNIQNTRKQFNKLISKFKKMNVDFIIIGCSELSVIKNNNKIFIDIIDVLAIYINDISIAKNDSSDKSYINKQSI